MKSILLLISPIILLVTGCIILNAAWPYYIICIASGTGLGFLAWLTNIQLKDNSKKQL
jgi:hypothetical protein